MEIISYASQDFELGIGYVYKWTNRINGMMYIGSHKGNNPKYLGSGIDFLLAVKEFGIENFEREFLYKGSDFGAVEVEILKAIGARQSPNFYNRVNTWSEGTLGSHVNLGVPKSLSHRKAISLAQQNLPKGKDHPNYGYRHTEEAKTKMSIAKSGENHPRYGKYGVDNPLYGYKHTEESRAKMSAASLGKKKSKQHAENISKAKQGITLSEEHRKKISEAKKGQGAGREVSSETRERIRASLTGTSRPPEVGLNVSYKSHLKFHVEQNKTPKKPCRWCNGDTLEQALKDIGQE